MSNNKRTNYIAAVGRLKEGLTEYDKDPSNELYQDAVIQRFEFTFELSHKAMKEYMLDMGSGADLSFPKQVLKEAYAAGIITDESAWLDMLRARNLTSHIYDRGTAFKIAREINEKFIPELESLCSFFSAH